MRAGDTYRAGAQAEIEGVFSSKSPIETSNGTTWVPESFEMRASPRVQVRVDIIQFTSCGHLADMSAIPFARHLSATPSKHITSP